jgi:hypothetical protein
LQGHSIKKLKFKNQPHLTVIIDLLYLSLEISDLYDFGLGFISSPPQSFGIKGFVALVATSPDS